MLGDQEVLARRGHPAGPKRTILQKSDASAPGREVVQVLVEIPAGARSGNHTHPGEEVGYVLEGTLVLTVDGKPLASPSRRRIRV